MSGGFAFAAPNQAAAFPDANPNVQLAADAGKGAGVVAASLSQQPEAPAPQPPPMPMPMPQQGFGATRERLGERGAKAHRKAGKVK